MSLVSAVTDSFVCRFVDAKSIFSTREGAERYLDRLKAHPTGAFKLSPRMFSSAKVVYGERRCGLQSYTLAHENRVYRRRLIYLPGGAFYREPRLQQFSFISSLAKALDACAQLLIYPKAPKYGCEEVVRKTFDWCADAMDRYKGDEIVFVGDSAGAGLCLSVCFLLKKDGLPLPDALFLISPFVNARLDDVFHRDRSSRDPLLGVDGLQFLIDEFRGGLDPDDPLISPVNGDLSGLPPVSVVTGTNDTLYPDARELCSLLAQSGVHVNAHEFADVGHDFIMLASPEAARAKKLLKEDYLKSIHGKGVKK
ncbi:MAG: alpha/beta hydrolase [Clostridia bacterium]|nr:alpha/beta hydrolase [Clostridia bacterium]